MPRHVIQPPPKPPKYDKLVKRLAQEIKDPGTGPQPLVLEEEVRATRTRHVSVIWDQWKGLDDEQRASAIFDAYTLAEGTDFTNDITLATGLTPPEALALGLLPWKLEPACKQDDAIPPKDYRRAVEAELPNTLLGPRARELRYARLDDAEAGLRRVEAALPGSRWVVAQEVPVED
jgi:hypothetical protein